MPIGAVIAGAQAAMGIVQAISGSIKASKMKDRLSPYKTPDEIYDILRATQSRAQQGYDPATLNYLTNQTDRAFDQALGGATRLGGDANDLSALFDQKMQGIMKIGAENHALNMENFSKWITATGLVADNAAAAWRSRQDLVKNELQQAGENKKAGFQNILSAANAFIGLDAAKQTGNLYGNTGNETNRQVINSLLSGGISPLTNPIRDNRKVI